MSVSLPKPMFMMYGNGMSAVYITGFDVYSVLVKFHVESKTYRLVIIEVRSRGFAGEVTAKIQAP